MCYSKTLYTEVGKYANNPLMKTLSIWHSKRWKSIIRYECQGCYSLTHCMVEKNEMVDLYDSFYTSYVAIHTYIIATVPKLKLNI